MNPYRSRKVAVYFALLCVFVWAFLAFIALHNTYWSIRFVALPLMLLYLWAIPNRR